jgi:hypothetical protein
MNSGAVIPYAIPKRVRKPRALKTPKEPKAPKAPKPIMMVEPNLINMNDKMAASKGQERILAAIKISNAIKSKIVRTAIKNSTANKAMNKAGDVLKSASIINRAIKSKIARNAVAKMKANDDAITVPIPKPKKERKAKPVYKISYAAALKEWNMNHNRGMYCNPRKGSTEYKAVVALRL